MPIFGQVWLWSSLAFLLGALLCWLLVARPARNRVGELETQLATQTRRPRPRSAPSRTSPGTRPTSRAMVPGLSGRGLRVLPRSYGLLDTPPPCRRSVTGSRRTTRSPAASTRRCRRSRSPYAGCPRRPSAGHRAGRPAARRRRDPVPRRLLRLPHRAARGAADVAAAVGPRLVRRRARRRRRQPGAGGAAGGAEEPPPHGRARPGEPFDARLVDDVDETRHQQRPRRVPSDQPPRLGHRGRLRRHRLHPAHAPDPRRADPADRRGRQGGAGRAEADDAADDLVDDLPRTRPTAASGPSSRRPSPHRARSPSRVLGSPSLAPRSPVADTPA